MDDLNRYRDNDSLSSDDESDNSDNECTVWKRAVKKVNEDSIVKEVQEEVMPVSNENTKPKRKRNTVWSDILEDQLISEDLGGVLLKNKPANYGSRGHESYDYTLKYDIDGDLDKPMSDDEMSCESEVKSVLSDHHNSYKSKQFVKLDSADLAVANKIIKVLNEKKAYLIRRVVKEVGADKAMALLKMTEQIEDSGGMMIHNNARRRTPGGVYIQLLKSDKDVTKEMLDKIFEGELPCKEMKKLYAEKKKRNKIMLRKRKHTKKPKENRQIQETGINEMASMEASEICDAVMGNTEESVSDNNVNSVPDSSKQKSDSELEEGEIDD